jgi:hypothetical protein
MPALRGEDGRTYVMIDTEEDSNDVTNPYINALTLQIEELQADKDHLWEENQRLQAIIMQLSQNIPDPKQQPEESVGLKELTEATRLVGEKTLWAITQYTRLRRKG